MPGASFSGFLLYLGESIGRRKSRKKKKVIYRSQRREFVK